MHRDTVVIVPSESGIRTDPTFDPIALANVLVSIVLAFLLFNLSKRLNTRQHEKDLLIDDIQKILNYLEEINATYGATGPKLSEADYASIVKAFQSASKILSRYLMTKSQCGRSLKKAKPDLPVAFIAYKKIVTGGAFEIGAPITSALLTNESAGYNDVLRNFRSAILKINKA